MVPVWRLAPLSALVLGFASACTPDNSVGRDTVPGVQLDAAVSGSGGTTLPVGSAGSTGSGGSSVTTGSGGTSIGVSTAGVAGTGGAGPGVGGTGGTTTPDGGAGSRPPSGGTTGSGGGNSGSTSGPITAGGDSKCAGSTAKLCDGFEEADVGGAGSAWTALTGGGTTVAVDTSKPYRGSKSVHITFKAAANAQGFITETKTFSAGGTAAMNNALWGRMFVWYQLDAGQTAPAGHFVFIRAEGGGSQLHIAGGHGAMLGAEMRTNSDMYKYASPAVPVPAVPAGWHCWEWHTEADNTLQFFIDGKVVPGMAVTAADKWPFPNFSKLYLGWLDFSAGPTGQMWIDEVALGSTQVGCDN